MRIISLQKTAKYSGADGHATSIRRSQDTRTGSVFSQQEATLHLFKNDEYTKAI